MSEIERQFGEMQQHFEDYVTQLLIGKCVTLFPDYENMETTNRISTNNGTWTVDRNGFVLLYV